MSLEAARSKFADMFTTFWAVDYNAFPIKFENRKFNQIPNKPFACFSVVETSRMRKSVGTVKSRFVRVIGYVVMEFYVPEDTGTKLRNQMMDAAALYFEEQNIPLVTGRSATTLVAQKIGEEPKDGYSRGTVMVPYWLDEQVTIP